MRDLLKYADAHSQMDLTSSFDEFFSLLSDANKDIGSIPAFTRLQKISFIVVQSIESMFNALSIKNIKFSNVHMVFDANHSGLATIQATRSHLLSKGFDVNFVDYLQQLYLDRMRQRHHTCSLLELFTDDYSRQMLNEVRDLSEVSLNYEIQQS